MGSAASPQHEPSADTESSPGAAHPGTPAAASRGGRPPNPAPAAPEGSVAPALPGLSAGSSPDDALPSSPDLSAPPSPDDAPPSSPDLSAPPSPDDAAGSSPDLAAGSSPDDALPSLPDLSAPSSPDLAAGSSPDDAAQPALDALAADLAPASLGALAAEPPATEAHLREEAFNAAWRFIARRERTEAEVRARLERNDVEPPLIDEVLDELQSGGYVDDAGYATRFAEDRRNLDGWGAERIERRLRELGVDRLHIAAALAAGEHDELTAATALLARRYPVPPDAPRDREKALGFLVRKGFALELAHDALRRHAASAVER